MIEDKLTVRAFLNFPRGGIELYADVDHGERVAVAQPVSFEVRERNLIRDPMLVLTEQQCEALMSDLWNAGIRPKQAKDSTELVAALKHHRDDAVKVRDQALGVALR